MLSVAEQEVEDELMLRIRNSLDADLRSFEQLVALYRGRIVANCRHITGDPGMADDLAQEVFVKAYFGLRNFEGKSTVGHWLRVIKVRHCINHLKKTKSHVLVDAGAESLEGNPALSVAPVAEQRLDVQQDSEQVSEVLESMPAALRVVLVLRDMDDLSYLEIAEHLGISLSAVKMRIKRARDYFRRAYQELKRQEHKPHGTVTNLGSAVGQPYA